MRLSLSRILGMPVLATLLWNTPVAIAEEEKSEFSGYLEDSVYAQLEEVETDKEDEVFRWIGPRFSFENYQSFMVDPVQFYPEPEPTEQVSAETLDELRSFLTQLLNDKVGAALQMSEEPGPGVATVQLVVTGISVKTESMKAYEVLPVTAIFGAAKAISGKRDRDVVVHTEARWVDSVSGEVLGAAVSRIMGKDLKGKADQLTVEHLKKDLLLAVEAGGSVWIDALQGAETDSGAKSD